MRDVGADPNSRDVDRDLRGAGGDVPVEAASGDIGDLQVVVPRT
jgi:hypothetical protein